MIASTLVAPYMKYYYEELGLNVLVPMFELGSFDASTGKNEAQLIDVLCWFILITTH